MTADAHVMLLKLYISGVEAHMNAFPPRVVCALLGQPVYPRDPLLSVTLTKSFTGNRHKRPHRRTK